MAVPETMQEIPQLLNPGEPGHRGLLPSFLYIPGDIDFPAGSLALPWDPSPSQVIGDVARRRGAENPSRLVASAKSWLSHGGASRKAPILPWGAPSEVPHISPVEASAAYLRHLAAAFDQDVAGGKRTLALSRQDVLLTVPASFDEEARELTVQAAAAAGLTQVTLLEEPQAAFYAWIDGLGDAWRRRVAVGDLILVCDVGGGTTDFSLITVAERDGDLALERVAVGEHILLGGDNMPRFNHRPGRKRDYLRGFGAQFWNTGASASGAHGGSELIPGFGASLKKEIKRRHPAWFEIHPYGEVLPYAHNRITVDRNRKDRYGVPLPSIDYRIGENERKMAEHMNDTVEEIVKAAGGELIGYKRADLDRNGSAIHEHGTCRMGTDPKRSALNRFNQMHEVKNLFVVDGSAFPNATEKNPTLTILALSWRATDYLAEQIKRGDL